MGKDKASTAEEKETASKNKKSLQIEEEAPWLWKWEEGDCLSTDGDDDDEDEDGVKAVIPEDPSAVILGNCGVIAVLFETPSGFAIFGYYGTRLLDPDAWQHIWADFVNTPDQTVWLKEFQAFEDKLSAINKDAISPALVLGNKMPVQVQELMWGLEIQILYFVPEENPELANEDRFRMSKGMAFLLNRHNFNVKPGVMVIKRIIETAALVYECDRSVDKHAISLRHAATHLERISHIDAQDWDLLKLATALKLICYPEEKIRAPRRLFTKPQVMRLKKDAPKYEDVILKAPCLEIYNEMYTARKIRCEAARALLCLVERAKRAYEAELPDHEIDPDSRKIRHCIDPVMIDELREWHTRLSTKPKKRQVPPTLAPVDALQRYTLISSHPLNKPNEPGILSLDIHPSQDIIATGGIDTDAILFDRSSGEILCRLTGHSKKITSLKFVNQNGLFITGSADKTVRIWQGSEDGDYSCIHTLKDHTAEVEAVTVHASQKYFVTTSRDNSWCFYDISTGSCVAQVGEASGQEGYTSAASHPEGLILGTGTTDGVVKIWNVKTQSKVANFDGHVGPVAAMSFSENGYFLATAALDGVKLWDLRSSSKYFMTFPPCNSDATTNAVEFDFSGRYLAIGSSDIRIYQVANPKVIWNVIKTLPDLSGTGKITSIKFGVDAKYIAVGSMDQNLRIFGLQSY
ncbi:hypothetical protein ACQ4PT_053324 [Festuca glaucescens]